MFNEAFWFVYAIGIFTSLTGLATGVAIIGIILSIVLGFMFAVWLDEDGAEHSTTILIRQWLGRIICTVFIASVLAVGLPRPAAMYAGGGLYVAEVTEIDNTLLNLKAVLDAKIEELATNTTTE